MSLEQLAGPGKTVSKDGRITIMGIRNGLGYHRRATSGGLMPGVTVKEIEAFNEAIIFLVKICGIDISISGNTKTIIREEGLEHLYVIISSKFSNNQIAAMKTLSRDEFFYYLNEHANVYSSANDMTERMQIMFPHMPKTYAEMIVSILYVLFTINFRYGPKFLRDIKLTRNAEELAAKAGSMPPEPSGLEKLFGPGLEPPIILPGKFAEKDVLDSINGNKRIVDGYRQWAIMKGERVDMEFGLKEYEKAFQQLRKAGKITKEFTGRVIRGKYKEYVYKGQVS